MLPEKLEAELVKYCKKMDHNYFGLRRRDVRTLAWQLAMRNNIDHPFSNEKAGKKWLKLCLQRHPELRFRQPQAISVARAQAFTEENVAKFFSILKPELEKVQFRPNRVFNVDETGITVVQHRLQQVSTLS